LTRKSTTDKNSDQIIGGSKNKSTSPTKTKTI